LAVVALSIGGAMMIASVLVYQSLVDTIEGQKRMRSDDFEIRLLRPLPKSDLLAASEGYQGVEMWDSALVSLVTDAQARLTTERVPLLGVPSSSALWRYKVTKGERLSEGQGSAVVNQALIDKFQDLDLQVGRTVEVIVGAKTLRVKIVGIIEEVAPASLYVSKGFLFSGSKPDSMASALKIKGAADIRAALSAVEESLIQRGGFPVFSMTRELFFEALIDHLIILLITLSAASVGILVVSALTLSSHMTLMVLERTRELGVIRAMGASSYQAFVLLLQESALLLIVAAFSSMLLALPIAKAIAGILGRVGLHSEISLVNPTPVFGLWVLVIVVASLFAVLPPFRLFVKLSLREAISSH
jgi:putative ABC transport system permease protein